MGSVPTFLASAADHFPCFIDVETKAERYYKICLMHQVVHSIAKSIKNAIAHWVQVSLNNVAVMTSKFAYDCVQWKWDTFPQESIPPQSPDTLLPLPHSSFYKLLDL